MKEISQIICHTSEIESHGVKGSEVPVDSIARVLTHLGGSPR